MIVKHNITAMNSNRMLGLTSNSQAKSTEKLSSGYKINRAADDAAGLAISEKMRRQVRGLTQASANAQDGISVVQTAEGALNEVQDMLQRMNELAVKAANGPMSESDRDAIQMEIDQLTTEIDRVSETTKFNETYLLKGDRNASKLHSFSYKTYDTAAAGPATAKDAAGTGNPTDAATGITAEFTFEATADMDAQNELAKALKAQGISVTATSEWDATATPAAPKASVYAVGLNGSAADKFNVVTSKVTDQFEIQDKAGNKIATVKVSGHTNKADATTTKKIDTVNLTAASITAAAKEGEKIKYYDADGNGVAENALHKYVDVPSGETNAVGKSGAPKVYDAVGNEVTIGENDVNATKDLMGALKMTLHVGADATTNNQISVNIDSMSAKSLGINGLKVNGADDKNALNAIETIKEAIQKISDQRDQLGAVQNRLEHTISNLDNIVENTQSAEAAIRDTDIAKEMVQYTNNNILQQAGTSMLSQANQSNQLALSLLG